MDVTQRGDGLSAVEAFHAGNELALAEIYDRWAPLVYSLALRSLGNVTEAEEVTQRVFTVAWTSRQAFDPGRDRLPAWLVGLTRHQIDAAQTARRRPQPPALTTDSHPEDTIDLARLAESLILADGMSRMDALPKQVLRMAFHDDLTHAQIADRIGLPPDTVRDHIRRSLLTLREQLEVTDAH